MKLNFAFWHHYLMRLKPFNIAFLGIVFTLAFAVSAYAQEDRGQSDFEASSRELRTDPDPTLSESESRSTKTTLSPSASREAARDTTVHIQVKPVKPLKTTEKHHQKEEDPLSFNFLYYIIEKFKLSDMIE